MPEFDFDIKKKEWRPKCVHDLVKEVERAFEAKVSIRELNVMGTDYMQKQRIVEDEDLTKWLKTESKTYEKLIKAKVPPRLLPKDWQPKKMMILGKGNLIAKYFGDEEVSTRTVQFTLKILDCGHFRLKQTLPGSGASPYFVIFEGTWERTSKGYQLEFKIRYPFQKARKSEFDLAFEAMPEDHASLLAFCDETEKQINGNMPCIVGTDAFSWVELVHEHVTENNPKTRFNLEDEDEQPRQPTDTEAPRQSAREGDAPSRPPRSEQASPATEAEEPGADEVDTEPMWPMYVGLVIFLAIVLWFSWSQWGGWPGEKPAPADGEL
mmetsp:Transcript_10195/g.21585  ORF Transcript_10195/g.21585 Transcript_10195/m.21585 type:complete len:323 (-) Transcript_10195:165-1133(-)